MNGKLAHFIGAQDKASPKTWQCHRTDRRNAINRQTDVHRPIRSHFTKFSGAVYGINDPDTPFIQPLFGVLALFGKQSVCRPPVTQGVDQKFIGSLVSCIAECFAIKNPAVSHQEQYVAGSFGKLGSEFGIGHSDTHFSGMI